MRCYVAGFPDLPLSHPQTSSSCSHILGNKPTCPVRKKSIALQQDYNLNNVIKMLFTFAQMLAGF